uniref:Venom IPPase 1 n=1 Tax=Oncocephalus sp. TaxID=2944721 RepID=A0AB38ZEK1_9HEMI
MKLFSLVVLFITFATINAFERYITVHVATWNVNEKKPPGDLDKFLGQLSENADERPDIVIVGLQEVTMSVRQAVTNYFLIDRWTQAIEDNLTNKNYVKIKTVSMLGVVLNAYVLLEHAWTLDHKQTDRVMTGFAGLSPNKGGVLMKFKLYDRWFCLVNAHFHAHDKDLSKRINDFATINERREEHCNFSSDYIFWLGDLNFRIVENIGYTGEKILSMINQGKLDELLENDQLFVTKKAGEIFSGFSEAPINFPPTYKIVVDEGRYNLKRRPAWTDRILYKSEAGREITPIMYKSIESYKISDHYPVHAQFKIMIDTDKSG